MLVQPLKAYSDLKYFLIMRCEEGAKLDQARNAGLNLKRNSS